MSGTGRTRSDTAAAGNSEGDLSSPVIQGLTAEAIQAMISTALSNKKQLGLHLVDFYLPVEMSTMILLIQLQWQNHLKRRYISNLSLTPTKVISIQEKGMELLSTTRLLKL